MIRRALPFLLALLAAPLPAQERDLPRVHFTTTLSAPVPVQKGGDADAARAAYDAWKRGGGAMTADAMGKVYQAAGKGAKAFKTVAWLIQSGAIDAGDSVAMARVREAEIERLIAEIGREKGWKIARSDSGNVTSGMKSDLDQTFYVFEVEQVEGVWKEKRRPDLDGAFIAEFNRRWQARHAGRGLSLEALDIASIEGRNRFPDPRVAEAQGFWREHRRAAEALRHTPGAYTYAGAVGHQMQFRAFSEILRENPRAYQVYGPDAEGEWGNRGTDADEAVRVMFGDRPDLRPAWAFGAALANFLELQGYMDAEKFETKYHLRTWEDSLFSQWLVERGMGRDEKVELIDLDADERKALYDALLDRLFVDDDARRRHALALEISVAQRLAHKEEFGKIPAFADGVPADAAGQQRKIFDRLGAELYGDAWRADPEAHLPAVQRAYRQLASEFCLETAYRTAPEALATLLGTDDSKHLQLDRYQKLLGVSDAEWPEVRRRLADAAHLTFLYGIYDLGAERSLALMNRLRQSHGLKVVPRLAGLWLRGQAQWFESRLREPGRYASLYAEHLAKRAPEVADGVRRTVLSELGWQHRTVIDRATGEITGRKLAWSGRKFLGNMAYDPGNLDALAQIVRTFVESKGDWEAVQRTIVAELVMAVPVAGQLVGAARGGVAGLAAMGVAWAYPPAGAVLVAVSVAGAGYAIYDVEKARPEADNLANAVYRGFVGPETYYFDVPPPAFTDADETELADLRRRLRNAQPTTRIEVTYDLETLRRNLARIEEEKRRYAEVAAELQPRIRVLKAKKHAWEEFRDDPAYGGYFSGAGAQMHQRPFAEYLLASIRPVIGFSPAGVVDFTEETNDAAVAAAERELRDAAGWRAALEAEAAYTEAALRAARRARAERYRVRMTGRARGDEGDLDPREERMGNFELLFRMKRDSLYPELRRLGYDDADAFVDAWLRDNTAVVEEAIRHGLLDPNDGPIEWRLAFPRPIAVPTRTTELPAATVDALRARLRADLERSQALFEAFREREDARRRVAEEALARRIAIVEAEAAGVAARALHEDPMVRRLYEAMRTPVAGITPPAFQATVYVTDDGYDLAATIDADPAVFRPPYRTELRALTAEEAWTLAESGRFPGLVAHPSTARQLRGLFGGKKPEEGDQRGVYVFVVSAFASGVAEGVEGVPGGEGRRLIGQALSVVREEPEETFEWFLDDDANVPYACGARVAERFPEVAPLLNKRKPVVHTRNPIAIRPRAFAIDWDAIAGQVRRDPSNAFHVGQEHKGPMHARLTCRGQVRHVYYVEREGRTRLLFRPRFSLPDGEHVVQVAAELGNGARFQTSFTMRVALKRKDQVARARKILAEAEKRQAERGGNRHYVRSAAYGLGMALMYEGRAQQAESLASRVAELTGAAMEDGTRGEPKWTFNVVKPVLWLCREVGTPGAYATAASAWEEARTHVGDHGYAEQMLAEMALATGNPGAARRHWDRYLRLDKGAARKWADPASYWPK